MSLLTDLQERAAIESALARKCARDGDYRLAVFMQQRAAYRYACARAINWDITPESSDDRPLAD